MATTDKILTIQITEGAGNCVDCTDAEADALQTDYEERANAALATAYPDADISLDVDRRTDARRRITVYGAPDSDGNPHLSVHDEESAKDDIDEILERAWQDACEAMPPAIEPKAYAYGIG